MGKKKIISFLLVSILLLSSITVVVHAESADLSESGADVELSESGAGSIESAIAWAINIASDNTHGYSQLAERRTGPDYDCASFVSTAFKKAGFSLSGDDSTATLKKSFVNAGFTWIPVSSFSGFPANTEGLKRGDVLLANGHTALYLGNNEMVHARGGYVDKYDKDYPGDQTGNEIAVTSYYASGYSKIGGWQGVLRYLGTSVVDLGTEFYADILTTSADKSGLASTGAEEGLAETGHSYPDNWRNWSQGDSDHYGLKKVGCWIVAMSKMLMESGVAESGLNPDVFYWWERNNGWVPNNDNNLLQKNGAQAPVAYAEAKGKTLTLVTTKQSPSQSDLWSYINKGYYIIVKVASFSHYVYIDNSKSKSTGTIYEMDSSSDNYFRGSYSLYGKYGGADTAYVYKGSMSNGFDSQDLGAKFYADIIPTGASSTLAVAADSTNDVKLAALDHNDYQKWLFERQSNLSYKITNVATGKCLDIKGGTIENKTNIQVYNSNDSAAQRWYIAKNGSGYSLISAKDTGYAVDINGGTMSAGTNIQLWKKNTSNAQIFNIKKLTYTLNYTPNGASGSVVKTSVSERDKITVKANPFTKSGYTFGGYFLYRNSDDKWYTESNGWVAAAVYKENGYMPKLFSAGQSFTLNGTYTTGAAPGSTFALQAQWLPNESKVNFAENYSGCNYLLGSDLASDYSNHILSRDTDTYTISVDPEVTYNNQKSLKITGASAGSSGHDLKFQTTTNDGYGDGFSYAGIAGDNKNMVMSFYAKSSVDGAKFYVRWGYSSTFQSVTLSNDWKYYTISIPKVGHFGSCLHPYFDKAGIFYLNSVSVSDGDTAPDFVPETGRWASSQMTVKRGGKISKLPAPQTREGYTFAGWYTSAGGGTAVTENTAIQAQKITLYAHWIKDDAYIPAQTAELNGHRYEFYEEDLTWNMAYRYCESKGGHLVTISDKQENDFVYSLINKHVWLGGCDIGQNKNWYWVNGEKMTYTNWKEGQPDGYNGLEHYMMMYYHETVGGQWNDYPDTSTIGFVCEYDDLVDPDNYSPVLTGSYNGKNYEIYDDSVDWLTAKNICSKKGGNLVVIKNSAENDYVYGLISQCGKKEYWIGATDIVKEGDWLDIFGNPLTYTHWAEGEPNNTVLIEDRALMNQSDGTWNDFKGYGHVYHSMGFICEYSEKVLPESIEISDEKIELGSNESYQASAIVYPAEAETSVTWSIADNTIAEVDESGYVLAISPGITELTATTDNGLTAKCTVIISQTAVPPEYIELSEYWCGMETGETQQITAAVFPEGADQTVLWSSNNDSVVSVDENGLISAIGEGEAVITAETADGTCSETVYVYVNGVYDAPEYVSESGFAGIVNNDGTVYAFEYFGTGRDIVIPSTIEGRVVSEISYYLLQYEQDYDSVTVPETISEIGYHSLGYYVDYSGEDSVSEEKLDNIVIKGCKGSAAESYANENGFTFEATDDSPTEPSGFILGDADGNGDIESVDVTYVQRFAANIPTPYEESQLMHADVDGDGILTVMDATAIQYYLCHLKTDYAIGETVS